MQHGYFGYCTLVYGDLKETSPHVSNLYHFAYSTWQLRTPEMVKSTSHIVIDLVDGAVELLRSMASNENGIIPNST